MSPITCPQHRQPISERIKSRVFQLVRRIPSVRQKVGPAIPPFHLQVESEKEKVRCSFEKEFFSATEGIPNLRSLPSKVQDMSSWYLY